MYMYMYILYILFILPDLNSFFVGGGLYGLVCANRLPFCDPRKLRFLIV